MSRKEFLISAATLAIAASLGVVRQGLAQAPYGDTTKGVVYVETNNIEAGQNAILAFRRGANGRLSPLGGSPYATGGTGVRDLSYGLAPFANDQPVIANQEHTLLFAVNEGSNSIAVFRIRSDGRLTPAEGSPFASNGYQPVSVGLVGDVLTVVNKNGDPAQTSAEANAKPNYTTFRVAPDGVLTPIANSTIDAEGSPTQALAIPQSQYSAFASLGYGEGKSGYDLGFVFDGDFGSGDLQSFDVGESGILRQNKPTPLPAQLYVGKTFGGGPAPALPLGLQVHPLYPILYVGLVTINEVGVYLFDPAGKLYFLDAVPDSAPAACWILLNKAGTRMYVVNTAANQVTTYDVGSDPIEPKQLSVTQLRGTGRDFQIALSGDEQFLYVISQPDQASAPSRSNALHVLQVGADGSTLTEIQTDYLPNYLPSPPVGTRWEGVVAF